MTRFSIRSLLCFCLLALLAAGCGEDSTGPTVPPPADMDAFLAQIPAWETWSPTSPRENVALGDPDTQEVDYDGDPWTCTTTEYSLTETPDKMTIFNPDAEVLWLGALLQGDGYRDGLGSLQELPIRQRAPMQVFIDLLTESQSKTVENPDASSVGEAVGSLIDDAIAAGHKAGTKISFDKKTTYSLQQASLDLGVSARFLGTDVKSQLEYDRTVAENTLTAYFIQQMFTISMVLPQTPGELFSDAFTEDLLMQQVDLGRMGPDNPPCFISSIVYGRMLMVTMTSSYSYERMRAALDASRDAIGGASIDAEDMQVLEESEFGVSAVGGGEEGVLGLIRTGRLGEYFSAETSLSEAKPLSYTVRPVAGSDNIAKVSETTTYNLRQCQALPKDPVGARYKIRLDKLRVISDGCDGLIAPSPEVYYDFDLHTPSGTSDFAARSAGNAVTVAEGGDLSIGAERFVNLRGSETMRVTGRAWDYDSASLDEVIGSWDLTWGWGTSNGQRYFTRSGNGCSIRLYVTITKIEDLYD